MRKGCGRYQTRSDLREACGRTGEPPRDAQSSRRAFLKAGAALAAGGAVGQVPPGSARAQGVGVGRGRGGD
jgi:hypothetical protein